MNTRKRAALVAAMGFVLLLAATFSVDLDGIVSPAWAQAPKPTEWSRTQPYPSHEVYYPGTEALGADEMRVVACGTGMPQPRLKQAAACYVVELGNGDKFVFDMGEGSYERIMALGIPLDQLDKVFLGHLHLDHAGDFPAFYFTGPVNNRLTPLRVWGPSGVKPEWGTKAWTQKMKEMWAWEAASRGSAVDPRGLELEVNEFDWTAVNHVVYDENGVVIRTIPAIHVDQSVSFVLAWNGTPVRLLERHAAQQVVAGAHAGRGPRHSRVLRPARVHDGEVRHDALGGGIRRDAGAHRGTGVREDHVADQAPPCGLLPLPERLRHGTGRPGRHPRDL